MSESISPVLLPKVGDSVFVGPALIAGVVVKCYPAINLFAVATIYGTTPSVFDARNVTWTRVQS